jgi:hypothetical protein
MSSRLTRFGEMIWLAEGDIVDFHGFPYPTRSVIVRLSNDDLWIWSPIALTIELRQEVRSIGRPMHLVSPNKLHHLYLRCWQSAFPDVKLWGLASTLRKRPNLSFQEPLGDRPPAAWLGQIDQCWVRGSFAMDEMAFFHRPSRTAILADLSENFTLDWLSKHWAGWQRPIARLSKIVEGWGYAPLDWRLTFVQRNKLREAKSEILGWDPEKVIMAHGQWQQENGKKFLSRALEWMD